MKHSNKIFIRDLEVEMDIGILPHEQGRKQTVLVSAEVFLSPEIKWNQDDVRETVRYDDLVARILKISRARRYNLLETFLESIADDFLSIEKVASVQIRTEKPRIIENAAGAGVEITRTK